MIEVWHMKHDLTLEQRLRVSYGENPEHAAVALFNNDGYERVAVVATDSLNAAYRLTNNIDSSWSMEPDRLVTVVAPLHRIGGQTYGRKSSEMGDIFIKDGKKFCVAMLGFTELPQD